jgi:hypothetical protein
VIVNTSGVIGTEGPRLTVKVDEAEPPADGVTEFGVREAETPGGAPVTLSATAESKPLIEFTVTKEVTDPPSRTDKEVIGLSEKLGLSEKTDCPGVRVTDLPPTTSAIVPALSVIRDELTSTDRLSPVFRILVETVPSLPTN